MNLHSGISSEIRSRIIAVAEQLYLDANSERFPTVDQVRRAARADMNSTSTVMKEWRRQQTAAPAAVAVAIPERVGEAMNTALAAVWHEAQELANESLAAAKQAWETERLEADAMRVELAEAYEQQAQELEAAQTARSGLQESNEALALELTAKNTAINGLTAQLSDVQHTERSAQERIEELKAELAEQKNHTEQQAQQYRTELAAQQAQWAQEADAHRAELAAERNQLEQQRVAHAEKLASLQQQRTALEQELVTVTVRAETQREAAEQQQHAAAAQLNTLTAELNDMRKENTLVRESAAGLGGKLDAVTAQNKALMAVIEVNKTAKD